MTTIGNAAIQRGWNEVMIYLIDSTNKFNLFYALIKIIVFYPIFRQS